MPLLSLVDAASCFGKGVKGSGLFFNIQQGQQLTKGLQVGMLKLFTLNHPLTHLSRTCLTAGLHALTCSRGRLLIARMS